MCRFIIKTMLTIALLLALPLLSLVNAVTPSQNFNSKTVQDEFICQADKLTVYKMVLHTFWSRENFPKHYPDWKPQAQWSKVIGRSHDRFFTMYRLGQRSTPAVKEFAETGRSDLFDSNSQGEGGVYDQFSAPPINLGVGRTEAEFFVDGNHSMVSLMSRVIPSPDWFIGIDSFDLCVNGNWLDSITIEVDPIDAGTDNGFTFTAPNWPTEPQGVAYKITAHYPAHPAGSFFYPYLKRLPPIATFQFIKVKEYELSEVFHHTEDDRKYELLKMTSQTGQQKYRVPSNNDIETEIQEERDELEYHPRRYETDKKYQNLKQYYTLSTWPSTSSSTQYGKYFSTDDNSLSNTINPKESAYSYNQLATSASFPAVVPKGDKEAIMNRIVDSYASKDKKQYKKYKKTRKNGRKIRPPRDCKVTDWSEWSPCSKSCGIGEMSRKREILKHARRGGKLCPPLVETKWCGSAQSCTNRDYYTW